MRRPCRAGLSPGVLLGWTLRRALDLNLKSAPRPKATCFFARRPGQIACNARPHRSLSRAVLVDWRLAGPTLRRPIVIARQPPTFIRTLTVVTRSSIFKLVLISVQGHTGRTSSFVTFWSEALLEVDCHKK